MSARFFTIHKYTLQIGVRNSVMIPRDGEVLTAQLQNGHLVLWIKFCSSEPMVDRYFIVAPTGNGCIQEGVDETLGYISTVQSGGFVWHVFEVLMRK